jgi:hypothetical protein
LPSAKKGRDKTSEDKAEFPRIGATDTSLHSSVVRWGAISLVVAAALYAATAQSGGNDTWIALSCGRYFLGSWAMSDSGRTWQMAVLDYVGLHLTKHDPFSPFSRSGGWINQNWLSHVFLYSLQSYWGVESLVVWKAGQTVATGLLVYLTGRKLGARREIAACMAGVSLLVSRWFIDMRPNATSVFLAAILSYLFACSQRGKPKLLFWSIPLLVCWSNVHGGFIFALLAFTAVSVGQFWNDLLRRRYGNWFACADPDTKRIRWSVALLSVIVPAVFSPFGFENVAHPFLMLTGEEGRSWREVNEWLPILNGDFDRSAAFLVFLAISWIVAIYWCYLRGQFFRSSSDDKDLPAAADGPTTTHFAPPAINLGHVALFVLTAAMAIQSRRFIFLSAVVNAPLTASMIQHCWDMTLALRAQGKVVLFADALNGKQIERSLAISCLAGSVLFAAAAGITVNNKYRHPRTATLTFFWPMVSVGTQPVRALEFIEKYQIQGTMFNEWVHGGFVSFTADRDSDSGAPTCQVFIDGRAQAAFPLEHYRKWQSLRMVDNRSDPLTYSHSIRNEGVSIVLLRHSKSAALLDLLKQSNEWVSVYADDQDEILLLKDEAIAVFARIQREAEETSPSNHRHPASG